MVPEAEGLSGAFRMTRRPKHSKAMIKIAPIRMQQCLAEKAAALAESAQYLAAAERYERLAEEWRALIPAPDPFFRGRK